MRRCPNCGSEMIIIDTHYIEVRYKIINGKRNKVPVIQKPNEENKLNSKIVCQNPGCKYTEDNY